MAFFFGGLEVRRLTWNKKVASSILISGGRWNLKENFMLGLLYFITSCKLWRCPRFLHICFPQLQGVPCHTRQVFSDFRVTQLRLSYFWMVSPGNQNQLSPFDTIARHLVLLILLTYHSMSGL
jgi:hypothetical protein